jgi:hypothetical protein
MFSLLFIYCFPFFSSMQRDATGRVPKASSVVLLRLGSVLIVRKDFSCLTSCCPAPHVARALLDMLRRSKDKVFVKI